MTIKYLDSKRIVATSADAEISGTVTTSGSDTIITFTGDGTFTPTSAFNVEYLVVAGGGGGGGAYQSPGGAGGGGGGYKTNVGGTALGVTAQSYSINVGAGGSAGVADTPIGASYIQAGNGGDSSIVPTSGTSIISTGGGSGGVYNNVAGGNGGSGGGGSYGSTVGTGISGQGYAGGAGSTGTSQNAGSGGGAGGLGNNGSGTNNVISAVGGIGISSTIFDGTTDWYSGGGGAGQGYNGNTANSSIRAVGGSGVGGSGGRNVSPDRYGLNGTSNTGGGGGGGGSGGFTESNGGAGGSGIVIIKFATSGNTYDVDIGGKPTNVQDNSILVEKDTGRRYWFAVAPTAPTTTSNFPSGNNGTGSVNTRVDIPTTNMSMANGSVAFWVYRPSGTTADNQYVGFSASDDSQASSEFFIGYYGNSDNVIVFSRGTTALNLRAGSIPTSVWSHIVYTNDYDTNTGNKVYVNGIQVTPSYTSGSSSSSVFTSNVSFNKCTIGGNKDSGNYEWGMIGNLQQLLIYDKTLSQADVTAL